MGHTWTDTEIAAAVDVRLERALRSVVRNAAEELAALLEDTPWAGCSGWQSPSEAVDAVDAWEEAVKVAADRVQQLRLRTTRDVVGELLTTEADRKAADDWFEKIEKAKEARELGARLREGKPKSFRQGVGSFPLAEDLLAATHGSRDDRSAVPRGAEG